MQQSQEQKLYVLVEGKPESPEKTFFTLAMQKIWSDKQLMCQYEIIEVGGSSGFNVFAKLGYRSSEIHKTIPVLAIADSDYRLQSSKKQRDNSKLIEERIPKILYWPRHEWENYLLEETEWMADWIKQIPVNKSNSKFDTDPKESLEECLKDYFRQSIRTEYWECLKFNLAVKIDKYPSVEKPGNFDTQTLAEMKQWFNTEASKLEATVTLKKKPDTLFDDIMKELPWETWLISPDQVDSALAKQRFRGKEAFSTLCEHLSSLIHNFNRDFLTSEILRYSAKQGSSSAMFQDFQSLLLPELSPLLKDQVFTE